MIDFNDCYIDEDFLRSASLMTCDFKYFLRMTLFRAANEADRRYYLYNGEKAKEYRRLSYELDEMASVIEDYIDEDGRIKPQHMASITEAVILSRYLILLDQVETRFQHEALLRHLVFPLDGDWLAARAA